MISLVLSGGVGSRLWPVSRENLPKQFSPLFGEALFSQTVKRQQKLGPVYVCTALSMKGLTESSIRNDSLTVEKNFYEPFGRNTAPAIGLVCKYLQRQKRMTEVVGVFPSDHWIEKQDVFANALLLAEECARQNQIVTIGLKPTYPATGFGYIDCQTATFSESHGLKAHTVKAFKEKPKKTVAQEYLNKGHYFWNSGMFVFQLQTMVEAFEAHLPETWRLLDELDDDFSNIESVYKRIDPESIDFGIMEKCSNQVNIPCDIGWSDLGSWDDIAQASEAGDLESSNVTIRENSNNCYTYSNHQKTICLSDVDDLIVVETRDALLVTKKGQSQSVKQIVDQLKKQNPSLTQDHVFEYRPWGKYHNLHEEEGFKTKVIEIDPGQQLSYQSHKKRTEIWVAVIGKGEVVLNDEIIPVSKGKIVEIPQGAKHRMRNAGPGPLKFVEVQLGDYFGEDDIIRYSDDYERV
ncbi:MAG: mannose-1-phosphate guanylyltransferase/mannose-6-phosphate isomerase [Pseudomonadota bacterium]